MDKIVLVTDYTWPTTDPEARILAEVGATLLKAERGDEGELLRLVEDADAILTCLARVSAEVIRAGRKLRTIARYGIGVDNIDVEEASRLGILVTNVPAYCLDEVAEHALALLLSFARNICRYNQGVRAGNWSLQQGTVLNRVAGRRLGIVGFGKIGRTVAQKARGLGLEILAHDAFMAPDVIASSGARAVSLEELLRESDFVTLHTPLGPASRHLINDERLRLMKPTALLINTSRGGVVDLEALDKALEEGRIAGAGLDVFEPERLSPEHPLLRRENVIATPHVAFYSEESVLTLEEEAARNVAAVFMDQRPASVVNPEVLGRPEWAHLRG